MKSRCAAVVVVVIKLMDAETAAEVWREWQWKKVLGLDLTNSGWTELHLFEEEAFEEILAAMEL